MQLQDIYKNITDKLIIMSIIMPQDKISCDNCLKPSSSVIISVNES